jgi:hypothetical protein
MDQTIQKLDFMEISEKHKVGKFNWNNFTLLDSQCLVTRGDLIQFLRDNEVTKNICLDLLYHKKDTWKMAPEQAWAYGLNNFQLQHQYCRSLHSKHTIPPTSYCSKCQVTSRATTHINSRLPQLATMLLMGKANPRLETGPIHRQHKETTNEAIDTPDLLKISQIHMNLWKLWK